MQVNLQDHVGHNLTAFNRDGATNIFCRTCNQLLIAPEVEPADETRIIEITYDPEKIVVHRRGHLVLQSEHYYDGITIHAFRGQRYLRSSHVGVGKAGGCMVTSRQRPPRLLVQH
jgi:hypothetical protein